MMKKALFPIFAALFLGAFLAGANTRTIARVHAGDLVEFEGGWTTRLTGISVPSPRHPVGWLAYDFTKRRLEGQHVILSTWTRDNTAATIVRDADDRPFGQILFGKEHATDIAVLLLERGFARVDEAHLPDGYDHYRDLERKAQRQRIGLWADAVSRPASSSKR